MAMGAAAGLGGLSCPGQGSVRRPGSGCGAALPLLVPGAECIGGGCTRTRLPRPPWVGLQWAGEEAARPHCCVQCQRGVVGIRWTPPAGRLGCHLSTLLSRLCVCAVLRMVCVWKARPSAACPGVYYQCGVAPLWHSVMAASRATRVQCSARPGLPKYGWPAACLMSQCARLCVRVVLLLLSLLLPLALGLLLLAAPLAVPVCLLMGAPGSPGHLKNRWRLELIARPARCLALSVQQRTAANAGVQSIVWKVGKLRGACADCWRRVVGVPRVEGACSG